MEDIKSYTIEKKEGYKKIVSSLSIRPKLVIVQVNDDPASNAYIRGKLKDLDEIGANGELIKLPIETSQEELLKVVDRLNKDKTVTGFIVQLPLPKGIDEELIKRSVIPEKDVDGFNALSSFVPATPKGIETYLIDQGIELDGKNAVIIGRSNIVGKPMQRVLLSHNMNVIILHSHTSKADMKFYIEHADLIVVAVGKSHFLTNEYNFKKDAIVMDVGINRNEEGKI
jgi:methylenetetrahydrofolate dehydrogenase (NADP+) / methenyltetrahydrofolate cyclohydrolase